MNTPVPTKFAKVARQTRSAGLVAICLPFAKAVDEYLAQFLYDTCIELSAGRVPEDAQRHLQEAGLDDRVLTLSGTFVAQKRNAARWNRRPNDLERLASLCLDLTLPDGLWQEQFAGLADVGRQASQDVLARLEALVTGLLAHEGAAAAREVLRLAAQKMDRARHDAQDHLHAQGLRCWSPMACDELKLGAQHLQSAAKPRGLLAKLRLTLHRNDLCRLLGLSVEKAGQSRIARAEKSINAALDDRHALSVMRAHRQALDQLLGHSGKPGDLARLFHAVCREEQYFQTLQRAMATRSPQAPAHRPWEMLLVEGLGTVLDPATGRTLADLYHERAQRAGASPQHFAAQLRSQGLLLDGRPVLPHDWVDFEPTLVARQLRAAAEQYLGFPTTDRAAADPRTAFGQIAAVTMLDPELAGVVDRVLPAALERVAPYATFRSIAGASPSVDSFPAFLFCHPAQRATWVERLQNRLMLADEASHDAYALSDPYRIVICQCALGIPGGAIHGLSRWMTAANEGYRRGIAQPLHDPRDSYEVRLLAKRVKDHDDCQKLLEASRKARLMHPVGEPSSGYALARPDPRLEHLFADRALVPTWQDADFFQGVLRSNSDFGVLVQAIYPQWTDFPQTQARLAREHDGEFVAGELVGLGILERSLAGQYRMSRVPPDLGTPIPPGLYTVEAGKLRGIPPERFIAQLQSEDLLYNVLFWGVRDAWQRGLLSQNDLPPSVRDYRDE